MAYLERIVIELLNNAYKYTPPHETITLSIHQIEGESGVGVAIAPPADSNISPSYLVISITNTGIEISIEEQARVFDKFYRLPHHDPWRHGGTGLGLALVKKLAQRLQAQVELESGSGQTTFRVRLAIAASAESV